MSFDGHAVQGRASFRVALDLKSSSGSHNFAAAPFIADLPREVDLISACYGSTRMKHGDEREDVVVNQMLDSSGMRYAVIAGLRTETGPERLVIAYANEKSLRDFIAAPSMIAVDFSSREHGCDRRRKTPGPVRSARARVPPSRRQSLSVPAAHRCDASRPYKIPRPAGVFFPTPSVKRRRRAHGGCPNRSVWAAIRSTW